MAKDNRGGKRNEGNMDEEITANLQIRTMTEKEFIDDIVKNYNEFTRGDLQGVIEAYAMSTGKDEEKLLQEIDRKAEARRKTRTRVKKEFNTYDEYVKFMKDNKLKFQKDVRSLTAKNGKWVLDYDEKK